MDLWVSLFVTIKYYKSPNFKLVKHGFATPILLHCLCMTGNKLKCKTVNDTVLRKTLNIKYS